MLLIFYGFEEHSYDAWNDVGSSLFFFYSWVIQLGCDNIYPLLDQAILEPCLRGISK